MTQLNIPLNSGQAVAEARAEEGCVGNLAHPYSLAHMTALTLAPPAFIAVAAQAGFDMVGPRLQDTTAGALAYPLMDQPGMLRETLAQLQHTGLDVFDIEVVHLDAAFEVQQCLGLLGVGAELDARAAKVVRHDSDAARLADSFALLCEAAGRFGMSANIAFMPGSAVADLAAAAALPREWLHLATLCDAAPVPGALAKMPRQAQAERLLPGEGSLNLAGLLRALPGDLPLYGMRCAPRRSAPPNGLIVRLNRHRCGDAQQPRLPAQGKED